MSDDYLVCHRERRLVLVPSNQVLEVREVLLHHTPPVTPEGVSAIAISDSLAIVVVDPGMGGSDARPSGSGEHPHGSRELTRVVVLQPIDGQAGRSGIVVDEVVSFQGLDLDVGDREVGSVEWLRECRVREGSIFGGRLQGEASSVVLVDSVALFDLLDVKEIA